MNNRKTGHQGSGGHYESPIMPTNAHCQNSHASSPWPSGHNLTAGPTTIVVVTTDRGDCHGPTVVLPWKSKSPTHGVYCNLVGIISYGMSP